jgi:DNA-binding SARP family transcriptional activator
MPSQRPAYRRGARAGRLTTSPLVGAEERPDSANLIDESPETSWTSAQPATAGAVSPSLDQDLLESPADGRANVRVALLGKFEVTCDGASMRLQPCAQRLLAFIALHDGPVTRSLLAATLWPDTEEKRASANLRSTLWRLGGRGNGLVSGVDDRVLLNNRVSVDVHAMRSFARALLDSDEVKSQPGYCLGQLESPLLPGWWDEWVISERERLRILQMHALESLARRLLQAREYAQALECCLILVQAEQLRESAHRLLIATHVAEGNLAHAVQHYKSFRDLLWRELGLRPSPKMDALISSATGGAHPVPQALELHVSQVDRNV